MGIRSKEDNLFEEWKRGKKQFIPDGVVCEEAYVASKMKIAFVLKEYPHHVGDSGYDLREGLKGGIGYLLWYTVADIMYGIRMLCSKAIEEESRPRDLDFCKAMFRDFCVFNLNKEGGNSSTNNTELALIAMKDRKFIKQQFEIYDPDLTICGGTFRIFQYVVGDENAETTDPIVIGDGSVKPNRRKWKYPWYERSTNKYVVGINHPTARGSSRQSQEEVVEAIKRILRRKSCGTGQ